MSKLPPEAVGATWHPVLGFVAPSAAKAYNDSLARTLGNFNAVTHAVLRADDAAGGLTINPPARDDAVDEAAAAVLDALGAAVEALDRRTIALEADRANRRAIGVAIASDAVLAPATIN
jgi:hypothetical protein